MTSNNVEARTDLRSRAKMKYMLVVVVNICCREEKLDSFLYIFISTEVYYSIITALYCIVQYSYTGTTTTSTVSTVQLNFFTRKTHSNFQRHKYPSSLSTTCSKIKQSSSSHYHQNSQYFISPPFRSHTVNQKTIENG